MHVTAHLKNLRISPRKVRLVSGVLRGMDAQRAQHQLTYLTKRSALPIHKLLDSAMANAYNNFGLVKDNLFIQDILVNEGRKLKRYRPKGFGSTSPIEKKTSHITIVLAEKIAGLKADKSARDTEVADDSGRAKDATKAKSPTLRAPSETRSAPKTAGSLKGKLFRRKAI